MKDDAHLEPEFVKFKCRVNNEYDDIVTYNEVVDYIEKDDGWDGVWKMRNIVDHKGPLRRGDKEYKGSTYNVLVEWETGEKTWEPLSTANRDGIAQQDPVTTAIYADEQGLLNTPGWKFPSLRKIAKTQKRLIQAANQAKLHSFRTAPKYMYGFLVPRNYQQALEYDQENGNTRWQDATKIELGQIDEYDSSSTKERDSSLDQITRRSTYISSTLSNTMDVTKHDS